MACKTAYFNGWGECSAMLEDKIGGVLQEKGATAWTETTTQNITEWRKVLSLIADASRDALALPVDSFENTTDEVEILTSGLGKKSLGKKPIPSGIIYINASLCDYQSLLDLEDKWFDYIPFFEGGSHWNTKLSDGTFRGFRCKIGLVSGMPPEEKAKSFPVYIFFDNYNEFKNIAVFSDYDWNYSELLDYVPVGMKLNEVTAYVPATKALVVKLRVRGSGDGKTGVAQTTDWIVRKSNGTPVVAVTTVVDDGQGQYTLTVVADSAGTPVALASGEYFYLQAHEDDSTYITYLSEAVKFLVP